MHESELARKDPTPTDISPTGGVRRWPSKPRHPIEDVARDHRFGHSPTWRASAKTTADDRFVPKEGVLYPGLPMIACLRLPSTAADLLHRVDGAIPSARPWSPSRHPGRLGRRDHDGRAPCSGRLVERDRVVGRIRRDPGDVGVERLDQSDASRCVIDRRLGQHVGHDHPRPIDAEMELLPAALATTAVLGRGSFPFAHDGETRAIDDEMDRPLGRDAVQPDVQVPTPTRQRGVVGRLEISVHQR